MVSRSYHRFVYWVQIWENKCSRLQDLMQRTSSTPQFSQLSAALSQSLISLGHPRYSSKATPLSSSLWNYFLSYLTFDLWHFIWKILSFFIWQDPLNHQWKTCQHSSDYKVPCSWQCLFILKLFGCVIKLHFALEDGLRRKHPKALFKCPDHSAKTSSSLRQIKKDKNPEEINFLSHLLTQIRDQKIHYWIQWSY